MTYDIKLYDLDVVPSTIVMRELPSTVSVDNIILYALEAVTTDIKLRAFGALESAVSYYGILKRWTGATWIKEPLKVWDGASWATKPLKVWDGATWQLIDTTGI